MPDPITLFQAWIANWATGVVAILPISFAFGAGMMSAANPCGFAMLPAYLSLYLGDQERGAEQRSRAIRAAKAVYVGGVVTLGFVVLFGIVGLAIAAGGQFLLGMMPWAALATGAGLAVVGILVLSGKHLYTGLFARLGARTGNPGGTGARSFFVFGVGYGIASLSCTLPIFLVVVGSSMSLGGVAVGLSQFLAYALGMGVVLAFLTLGMALFKSAPVGSFQRALPYVERLSAVLILLMGSYLVYYWLTKGGLLARLA